MRVVRAITMAAAGMALTGCASLGRGMFKEPVVTFKDARVAGLGLTGGALEVVLDVYNPNGFRLDGSKVTYTILIDSVRFGDGEYNTRFQIDEGQTSEIRLPLNFTYAGVGAASRQLMQTGSVEYRVIGDITVGTPLGSFTRPYDQKGRFSTLSGNAR